MDKDLQVTPALALPLSEIEIGAVRSQGAGGQNVNKTSSAAHLRFDVGASSLPEEVKQRLLRIAEARATRAGLIVIKAQEHRSLEQNREAALERLRALIERAATVPRKRKPTKPTRSSQRKRIEGKVLRGRIKALRARPEE